MGEIIVCIIIFVIIFFVIWAFAGMKAEEDYEKFTKEHKEFSDKRRKELKEIYGDDDRTISKILFEESMDMSLKKFNKKK